MAVFCSTLIDRTRTKASGTGLTCVIVGNFRQLLLGRAGAIELAASAEVGFVADQTVLRCITRFATALAHPESFVIIDQLIVPS